ncbi:hypothetical protein ACOJVU_08485 [Mycobacterium sp. THU-M104]|uniref:hypothetical protein n=1 Tax=Mycobacterium sp. THU-M104 TaxID=3410515 RepID=UPI003B99778F
MATHVGFPTQGHGPRMAVYAGALTIAALSGICALAALAAGTPFEFGVGLALFGAGWVIADFVGWTAEHNRARAARRRAFPAAPIHSYRLSRVVVVGGQLSGPAGQESRAA